MTDAGERDDMAPVHDDESGGSSIEDIFTGIREARDAKVAEINAAYERARRARAMELVPLLRSLQESGAVLEAVPDGWDAARIEHRRADEVHVCLVCGERAQAAYVAHTDTGPRWLDLCYRDAADVDAANAHGANISRYPGEDEDE